MTTSVKVQAHCNKETTEVLITRTCPEFMPYEEVTIQDGESFEYTVYDDIVVVVKEVSKK